MNKPVNRKRFISSMWNWWRSSNYSNVTVYTKQSFGILHPESNCFSYQLTLFSIEPPEITFRPTTHQFGLIRSLWLKVFIKALINTNMQSSSLITTTIRIKTMQRKPLKRRATFGKPPFHGADSWFLFYMNNFLLIIYFSHIFYFLAFVFAVIFNFDLKSALYLVS